MCPGFPPSWPLPGAGVAMPGSSCARNWPQPLPGMGLARVPEEERCPRDAAGAAVPPPRARCPSPSHHPVDPGGAPWAQHPQQLTDGSSPKPLVERAFFFLPPADKWQCCAAFLSGYSFFFCPWLSELCSPPPALTFLPARLSAGGGGAGSGRALDHRQRRLVFPLLINKRKRASSPSEHVWVFNFSVGQGHAADGQGSCG